MHPVLATLERHCDGVLSGLFRTLSIRAQIEIRPQADAGQQSLTYRVLASPNFHLGYGEQRGDPTSAPIDFQLHAPEFAAPISARAQCEDGDRWSLIWLIP